MRNKKVECPKGKWLVVDYPSCDDKPEYRQPILCRAKDIGKIVYGMWIIGGEQCGHFQYDSYSEEAERFYTAYKLVEGAGIVCNFAVDETLLPFITTIAYPTDASRADASWDYAINSHIDSFRPRYEPNYAERNGVPYIVMPSGMEAKQTDDAVEEKFEGRPQIQKGDIVRFIAGETGKEVVEVVTCEIEEGASYTPAFSFNPFFNEVVAIYRFDGRDFKCIWESREYKRLKLNEVLARAAAGAEHMEENVKSIIAALEQIGRYAKEARDDKHGSEKAD